MAGIDKIYGDWGQKRQLSLWCAAHCKDALPYLYDWGDGAAGDSWVGDFREHPIANFPIAIDAYLAEHCPIVWVTDRIMSQYAEENLDDLRRKLNNIVSEEKYQEDLLLQLKRMCDKSGRLRTAWHGWPKGTKEHTIEQDIWNKTSDLTLKTHYPAG